MRLVVSIKWPDVVSQVGSQEAGSKVEFRGQALYQQQTLASTPVERQGWEQDQAKGKVELRQAHNYFHQTYGGGGGFRTRIALQHGLELGQDGRPCLHTPT